MKRFIIGSCMCDNDCKKFASKFIMSNYWIMTVNYFKKQLIN